MKTIESLLTDAAKALFVVTRDRSQAWLEAELLLGKILSKDRLWLLTHKNEVVLEKLATRFKALLKRRLAHEPLAYLFGEAPFYGRLFQVTRATLIPRTETEQLVDEAVHLLPKTSPKALIWDVGTGSGILAITLSTLAPHRSVIASDISAPALTVARRNAKRFLKKTPRFIKANLLDRSVQRLMKKALPSEVLVVANLPYLPLSQKRELSPQVTKYEPLEALFADRQGRALNEKLIQQTATFQKELCVPITLLLEIDPSQSEKLCAFAKTYFPITKILLDVHKRARFLKLSSS